MSNADPASAGGAQDWPPPPARPLQAVNRFVRSVPQLARALRWIAWVELVVVTVVVLINLFQTVSLLGVYPVEKLPIFVSLLTGVLQPFVFWGLLMGVALLLENQLGGRHDV